MFRKTAFAVRRVVRAIARVRTGRTVIAVNQRRRKLGILYRPSWKNKLWTEDEDKLVKTLPPMEAAEQTVRSLEAVYQRRWKLRTRRATGQS